jgi:hypothetical protein
MNTIRYIRIAATIMVISSMVALTAGLIALAKLIDH